MTAIMIIFSLIFLAFYAGVYIFLYFSFLKIYDVSGKKIKYLLLAIFLILSLSFPLFVYLSNKTDFFIIKAFYLASFFWLGALVYIIAATVLSLIIKYIFGKFKLKGGAFIFSSILVLIFAYLLIGAWNARHPEVKEVRIKISNLPEYWRGKTVVHLSDLHFGKINGAGFADYVLNEVNNLKPDLIVITGDAFDGLGFEPGKYLNFFNNLESKHGAYFVTGNHEHYLGAEQVVGWIKGTKVRVIDNEIVEIEGLQITGVGFPGFDKKADRFDILNQLAGYDSEKINLVLFHEPSVLNQDTQARAGSYFRPQIDFSYQKEMGVDLQLSGHTHAGQFFPFTLITKAIYQGYHYGLFQENGFQIYITSGTGTWGPPIRNHIKGEIVKIILLPDF